MKRVAVAIPGGSYDILIDAGTGEVRSPAAAQPEAPSRVEMGRMSGDADAALMLTVGILILVYGSYARDYAFSGLILALVGVGVSVGVLVGVGPRRLRLFLALVLVRCDPRPEVHLDGVALAARAC